MSPPMTWVSSISERVQHITFRSGFIHSLEVWQYWLCYRHHKQSALCAQRYTTRDTHRRSARIYSWKTGVHSGQKFLLSKVGGWRPLEGQGEPLHTRNIPVLFVSLYHLSRLTVFRNLGRRIIHRWNLGMSALKVKRPIDEVSSPEK